MAEEDDFLYRQEPYVQQGGFFTLRFFEFLDNLRKDIDTNVTNITNVTTTVTGDSVIVTNKSSDYTQVNKSERVYVDATAGQVTITLLGASAGKYCDVIKEDSSSNKVIVSSVENINGQTTQELKYQYESIECGSNGTTWNVL